MRATVFFFNFISLKLEYSHWLSLLGPQSKIKTVREDQMTPEKQERNDKKQNRRKHDALYGDEFLPDIESTDPEADKKVRNEIYDKLFRHPELNVKNIVVNVKAGFVSLTGWVVNAKDKGLVMNIVSGVDGVLDVVNFLQLKRPLEEIQLPH
jgi:osmotically-inducible protein OsmY